MEEKDQLTVYELGYHIATVLPEEKLGAEVTVIKDLLNSKEAEFIGEEFPKKIQLAYTISKKTQAGRIKGNDAYFGWIKFALEAEKIAEIKAKLEKNDNVLRFIIVKTVRENTMPVKTFNSEKKEGEVESKEEITEDDKKKIDESIEDLVTE